MKNLKLFIRDFLKEELSSIKYIYHGTSKGAALNIQKDGFMKPNSTGEEHPSISFTEKLDYAKYYAKVKGGVDKSIILRTLLTNNFRLSDRIQNNNGDEYVTFDPLSVDQLEIHTKDGWKSLKKWNVIFNEPLLNENSRADYLKWKRKNVTLRGIQDRLANDNGGTARFGSGLYSAALSNRKMAKEYGEVFYLVNAIPKHPKVVTDANQAEIFLQNVVNNYCKKHNQNYNPDFFYKHTTIPQEMINLGYDGLIVKGREMVNYTPPDNVLYFRTEYELENYYNIVIAK